MSEFTHSIVLFTGDDGLPLEFNVRNTADKAYLKALIEHGGGFCSTNENSVHLISPGTKVLNFDLGKKLVSTSYILDCVKQNYLLNVNDYIFTISEAQTSDISDEDSERLLARHSTCKSPNKNINPSLKMDISPIKLIPNNNITGSSTTSNLTLPSGSIALPQISSSSSIHSDSFIAGSQDVSDHYKITSHVFLDTADRNLNNSPKISELPDKQVTDLENNFSQSLVYPEKTLNSINKDALTSPCATSPLPLASPIQQAEPFIKSVLSSPKSLNKLSANQSPFQTISPGKCTNKNIPEKSVQNNSSNEHLGSNANTLMHNKTTTDYDKNVELNQEEHIISNNAIITISKPENQLFRLSLSPPVITNSENAHPEDIQIVVSPSPTDTVVSSSQPDSGELDKFDNMLLSKVEKKNLSEDNDSISQSYVVSSSADAQIASKPCSPECVSSPLLNNNSVDLPDSPNSTHSSQTNNYMTQLEAEVKEILQKTSPKTIQEKTTLVKYICCVRKLPPAVVLESLFSNSLDL